MLTRLMHLTSRNVAIPSEPEQSNGIRLDTVVSRDQGTTILPPDSIDLEPIASRVTDNIVKAVAVGKTNKVIDRYVWDEVGALNPSTREDVLGRVRQLYADEKLRQWQVARSDYAMSGKLAVPSVTFPAEFISGMLSPRHDPQTSADIRNDRLNTGMGIANSLTGSIISITLLLRKLTGAVDAHISSTQYARLEAKMASTSPA
jgi:hypothetical protein